MAAFWAILTYAYVIGMAVAVLAGGWRIFHPHDRYR